MGRLMNAVPEHKATSTTCIRGADMVIAWDGAAGGHSYLPRADVAFRGNEIIFVGRGYDGHVDVEVDGTGYLVLPGMVDIHSHPSLEPSYRGIREEHGVRDMYMTGLYERCMAYGVTSSSQLTSAEVTYCELLLSGVTTIVDLSMPYEGWLDLAERSGLRVVVGPGFASSRWNVSDPHHLDFAWDEEGGFRGLKRALEMIGSLEGVAGGRLTGIVYPAQIDTCTEPLLREAFAAAQDRKLPITTHVSQSVMEFREMQRRTGLTPVQWAAKVGILGPGTILGHAIFIDQHSWVQWWTRDDLDLIADTGTSVAHCPTPFARYGHMMEHVGGYIRRGVNVGIGTDTVPHNFIEEMRWALVLGRISARDIGAVTSGEIFTAATAGGAKALLREDIGRLAAGAKADIVLADLGNRWMQPARDPLRSLMFHAADRAIRHVYVDGRHVVKDGEVMTLDHQRALSILARDQRQMEEMVPKLDPQGRASLDITPLSLPYSHEA
jgi:cytosine/adenosine deaminase-related metal-dependent hydrolase